MSLYAPVESWHVPSNVLPDSLSAMAPDGRQGNEGLALWLGQVENATAAITHVVTLPSRWVAKRPDLLQVAPAAFSALLDFAEPLGVSLVGQIHSHPGTFVDLSQVDRRFGISAPYYLSVVAPYYAQHQATTWMDCGVHQFLPGRGFRRLSIHEIQTRIHVHKDKHATNIALGGKS